MRLVSLAVVLLAGAAPLRAAENQGAFNWKAWRDVPVQNGGRYKPLDTLSRETLRLISNRSSFVDPETGAALEPTALCLTMLFEWQGWQHPERERLLTLMDWRSQYFHLHQPDKWDEAPLLRIDYLELRAVLGLEKDQQYVSPLALSKAWLEDPQTAGKRILFTAWANRLDGQDAKGATLGTLEKKALELAHRYWSYQNWRMGRTLEILPVQGSQTAEWIPIAQLLLAHFDDASDPTGDLREAQEVLRTASKAYEEKDTAVFNNAALELKSVLRAVGPELGGYPGAARIKLEVAYNQWSPFRIAWVAATLAALGMLLHLGSRWKSFYVGSMAVYVLALVAMITGFGMRVAISGRPPVTNMYESVIYVGFGVAVFGLIFELIYRASYILTASAAVSAVALILADNSPTLLDSSVRPLEPVLRSNFWLVTHVMTITLSYAAFALALGISNITLGYFLAGSSNRSVITALSNFTYRAIQVGVLLLAAGIILGGVWADYSWGRFWGWDPKEVWALVALLGYLCMLHARFIGWVGQRGLAALSVVCFSLVVMAWYGVNFVLGAGLHSYGFGGGGTGWVCSAVVLQLLYASLAMLRSRRRNSEVPQRETEQLGDALPASA
jgi:cytochrome c-type biogenesis protein CcsB